MKSYKIFCRDTKEAEMIKDVYEKLNLTFKGVIPSNHHTDFVVFNENNGFCSYGDGCNCCEHETSCQRKDTEYITATDFIQKLRKDKLKRILYEEL